MEQKHVGTIVVTYNRRNLLKDCIEALLKQNYKKQEILIIDNASTDGTKEYIDNLIDNKKVFYFNTGANLGGAGGFNYGVREALKRNYDYVWLMDDDTIAENNNALKSLVSKASYLKDDFSFLSSIAKWTDGKICKMNRQVTPPVLYGEPDLFANGLIPCLRGTFVGFFANMKIVRKVGLPIKEFFIYSDDMEYSQRLCSVKPAYVDTGSVLLHKTKSNLGATANVAPAEKIHMSFYAHRNHEYNIRHYTDKRDRVLDYRNKYLFFIYIILRTAKDHKLKRCWYYTKGKIAGKFFNPKIEME